MQYLTYAVFKCVRGLQRYPLTDKHTGSPDRYTWDKHDQGHVRIVEKSIMILGKCD